MEEIFKYQFLQNAIISAILASIACGMMGTIITEKKWVMMSGGIAHTAFGGIGLGYFLGIEPMIGAIVFSVLAALCILKIHKSTHAGADILTAMFWSFGMALGIIFIRLTPGYPPDISSYLFGDILTVSSLDLKMMIGLDISMILIFMAYFKQFQSYLFDEEFTKVIGIRVNVLEKIVFILIALTIVILIRVVGIILVITLLTVPTSIARNFSYELKNVMIYSMIIGSGLSLLGLYISYMMKIPSGAAIIILCVLSYMCVLIGKKSTRILKKSA